MDFKFHCPHCTQSLEGPMEIAGLQVNCPTCNKPFTVPFPPRPVQPAPFPLSPVKAEVSAKDRKRHWLVDVRILIVGAPPTYIQLIIEAPSAWTLSGDGALPQPALDAVKKAAAARYPHSPATPTKVRVADGNTLQRIPEDPDYRNESCQVWFLGKVTSKLQA